MKRKTRGRRRETPTVGTSVLAADYQVEYDAQAGGFDLVIDRAQYDRDNGKFDCKVQESGNGGILFESTYMVTILLPPGPPMIEPSNPVAREGELFKLGCSSTGGSPDPIIQWFRDGVLVDGEIALGRIRTNKTTNTLLIDPTLELDKAIFKCVLWNRATGEQHKQESSVSLTVHCKFFHNFLHVLQ